MPKSSRKGQQLVGLFLLGCLLFNYPLLGRAMRLGSLVPVDRGNREAGIAAVRAAADVIKQGINMTIYIEGHRSFDGKLLPFKKGFAHFAVESQVPVVPVGLSGMGVLWLGKRLTIRIGEPIPAAGRTVDQVLEAGERAVAALVPTYVEPAGPKPLRRWLTGLF